jgi:hypothetical protein
VAGVRHRLAGLRSDDSFAWARSGARVVVAVADGLGSVAGSAETSRRCSQAAVLAALDVDDPADAARAGVVAANQAAGADGASTLVVAVVEQDGKVALARVGDSSAFVIEPGPDWAELFPGPDPDRPGTATPALPDPDPLIETACAQLGEATVLVLATDGVADPWRDGPTTVAPSLAEAILDRPSALDLLAVTDFSRQGCHDDRTLLCIWLRPPATGQGGEQG